MQPQSLDDAMRGAMKDAATVHMPPTLLAATRFEMREELGRGGTAVVYAAFDKKLQREVAVKVLREESRGDAEMAIRFRREAEMAAKLTHANIVTVYDVGWEAGRMILVMELVRGRTLAEALNANEVEIQKGAEILETIGRAVHYAHGSGIIHRDLKPGNLLLTAAGVAKVADFGLARKIDSETALTQTGTTLGTPWYMAPEQALGQSALISVRTDVYALGAILYHILTGRAPHQGDNAADVIRRVAFEDPLPPGALNPGAPRDLELVALRALEKNPARRYPDAASFADDLRRFLDGDRVLARPPSPARKAEKWVRKHVALSAAGTVFLLALASYGVILSVKEVQHLREVQARTAEVLSEPDPEKAARLCAALAGFARGDKTVEGLLRIKQAEARHHNAEVKTREGNAASARVKVIEADLKILLPERDALFASMDTTTTPERRHELYVLNAKIEALKTELSDKQTQVLHLYATAVQADPNYLEPRRFLSNYWWRRFKRAEWAGDALHMAEARGMLNVFEPGRSRDCDNVQGSVALASDPPGAAIEYFRYAEGKDPRLVLGKVEDPLEKLPGGSYLAILRLDGRRDTRFPFAISRKYKNVVATVKLLTEAEIGADFVHVPAGRFILGPDEKRKLREMGDLVVGKYEVTRAEYAEYLAALKAAGDPVELRKRTPPDGWTEREGRLVPGAPEYADGGLRLPMARVSYWDARKYCAWRAQRDGLPWRLPTTTEREAIARGADGRAFPWGPTFDWIWTNGGRSRPTAELGALPVGSNPADECPYGIMDLAGNVKEWCSNWQDKGVRLRGVRGGGSRDMDWIEFRTTFVDGDPEKETDNDIGFRMVRTVEAVK
ncbi:MAG: WD40 repeat-containing [Planctomycetota bacterium]|nr:MAG: WD40 repeat-containing [Planctomycetota bacterium]